MILLVDRFPDENRQGFLIFCFTFGANGPIVSVIGSGFLITGETKMKKIETRVAYHILDKATKGHISTCSASKKSEAEFYAETKLKLDPTKIIIRKA